MRHIKCFRMTVSAQNMTNSGPVFPPKADQPPAARGFLDKGLISTVFKTVRSLTLETLMIFLATFSVAEWEGAGRSRDADGISPPKFRLLSPMLFSG